MKRLNRKLSDENTLTLLINGRYGVLSTIDEDGQPYSTPLHYVYWNNAIYIHCGLNGRKLDNIIYNSKVSFCVVAYESMCLDKFSVSYKSVIAFGQAAILVQDELKRNIIASFISKYTPNYKIEDPNSIDLMLTKSTIIEIPIDYITGRGI